MKPIQSRENVRKLKLNPHQSKDVQSQSPPHKKLLKKIEMIHKEPSHKYDLSLKENLLAREPQEEVVVDFRVEIERRFMKALPNQVFKFPLKRSDGDSANESGNSSGDSSFESLKHVTIYDLSSQNNKRKAQPQKQALRAAVTEDKRMPKSVSHRAQKCIEFDMSDDSIGWEEEERSGIPIELRIRDKASATYRKLLGLIEQQINPQAEVQPPSDLLRALQAKKQQSSQEQSSKPVHTHQLIAKENNYVDYIGNINTVGDPHDVEIHKLEPFKAKKERNVKSQGRNERGSHNYSESQRASKAVSNSGIHVAKKNLSQEKVAKIETVPALGFGGIEKTLSRLNISTAKGESKTTVDLNKFTQENFKKMYNNGVLKSVTPQYVKSSKIANLKENVFKTYAQENPPASNAKTTMDSLYQKAKNEVLNHKLKVSGVNLTRSQTKIANNSMSATKRDETPKDVTRKITFNNFYGNSDTALDKSASKVLGHTSQNTLSKKESMKAFNVSSPYKKSSDSPIYASYDFSQSKVAKKPNFKLDLNKRGQAYRDVLSSTRNRKKRTPEKFSDVLNTESGIRNSYDMQQYSYILNNSSQKNTSKKPIGFTPSSVAKNLSFTKAFFSFK